MRRLKIPAVLLATLLAAACVQDGPTAPGADTLGPQFARAAAVKLVPFKATYHTQAGFTPVAPEVCPTGLADITAGGGQATHLGRFTGETFSCINLETLQSTQGRFTFTGADGSQVTGTFELQGTPLSETLIAFEGPFTITGGTRRFAGASGGGQVSGYVDLLTGELVLELKGQISSVGSLKRSR